MAMDDKLKAAGVVALLGAAVGGGLALGLGLRVFATVAMVGLGTGVALGVAAGNRPKTPRIADAPLPA
jgi:hypothetical protein